jgi:hypothetical protein
MSELDEIPFGKGYQQFSKYCEDNYKNIVINESELKNFKDKLFPKGIEYGLPDWMSLMVIKQHIEKHVIIMPDSSKKVNLNTQKEPDIYDNIQNKSPTLRAKLFYLPLNNTNYHDCKFPVNNYLYCSSENFYLQLHRCCDYSRMNIFSFDPSLYVYINS